MKEMPLTEHLTELRRICVRILVIVTVSFGFCYSQGDKIAEFLLHPLRLALEKTGKGEVVFLEVLDKVLSQLQVSFWSAIILSSPFWFREVWSFIRPGLYDFEAKVIRPFIFLGFFLFCLGVAFGYYIVFPLTFEVLLGFGVSDVAGQLSLKGYLVLCVKVLVALGIIFQLPNVILILGFMGLVTKQFLRKYRGHVYVAFSIIAGILTPPDPLTLFMLWIPLILLYEFGIIAVAIIVHPWLARQTKKNAQQSS
jgi:sec-independent protein translocase protein TatC